MMRECELRPLTGRGLRCSNCLVYYDRAGFNPRRASRDGMQGYCLACQDLWWRGVSGMWCKFSNVLSRHRPDGKHGWSEAVYHREWNKLDGRCHYCGGLLGRYQKTGYCVDRKENRDRSYHYDNCVIACWPCNVYKGRRPYLAFMSDVKRLISEHGFGKIPWSNYVDVQPYQPINMSRYKLPDPQKDMPLFWLAEGVAP